MRYIRFYYQCAMAHLRWHLHLTRSQPGRWWMSRTLWGTATTYHPERRIWGAEARRPKNTWKRITTGPGERNITYEQKSNGNAGKGDYLFEIPTKGWKP